MFVRKLQLSAILAGVFSVLAIIGTLSTGKSLYEVPNAIIASIVVALPCVFWVTRNMDEDGNEVGQTADQEVGNLQRQLRSAIGSATYNEAHGDWGRAAHFRARAAEIESQLRRIGA